MNIEHDVIVIGAGIVGTSTAQNLLMRGKNVLLIDRHPVGENAGVGNTGVIATSMFLPVDFPQQNTLLDVFHNRTVANNNYFNSVGYIPWLFDAYKKSKPSKKLTYAKALFPLLRHALEEHLKLMRGTTAWDHWHPTGRAVVYHNENSFALDAPERKIASEACVPFEIMDAASFGEMEPDLKSTYHKVVRWASSPRVDNPTAITKAYAKRFTKEGGTLLKTEARELILEDHGIWKIRTEDGLLYSKNVVICTGPWATQLLTPLGYHFPLGIKREHYQDFSTVSGASLSHAITDRQYGYEIAPIENGCRLVTIGSEYVEVDTKPNDVLIRRLLPHVRDVFPLGERLEPAPGYENKPCFPDFLPVIGKSPNHSGLWFNFGHGQLGLTLGPATSRLMAEMMIGEKPFCDPHPFRADRFESLLWNPMIAFDMRGVFGKVTSLPYNMYLSGPT